MRLSDNCTVVYIVTKVEWSLYRDSNAVQYWYDASEREITLVEYSRSLKLRWRQRGSSCVVFRNNVRACRVSPPHGLNPTSSSSGVVDILRIMPTVPTTNS